MTQQANQVPGFAVRECRPQEEESGARVPGNGMAQGDLITVEQSADRSPGASETACTRSRYVTQEMGRSKVREANPGVQRQISGVQRLRKYNPGSLKTRGHIRPGLSWEIGETESWRTPGTRGPGDGSSQVGKCRYMSGIGVRCRAVPRLMVPGVGKSP
ncbi:hypothetical protein L6452_26292 [Arctium lappa]|uniref:Uncharacterized protein n=1 Tax=Arctium lappa TaxID=4217 RepID=A0ACB9ADH2_ARCLA|nr:hypothetical protein L6452_26292 [Arctium lappa]